MLLAEWMGGVGFFRCFAVVSAVGSVDNDENCCEIFWKIVSTVLDHREELARGQLGDTFDLRTSQGGLDHEQEVVGRPRGLSKAPRPFCTPCTARSCSCLPRDCVRRDCVCVPAAFLSSGWQVGDRNTSRDGSGCHSRHRNRGGTVAGTGWR